MTTIIAGDTAAVPTLAQEAETDAGAVVWSAEARTEPGSTAALAEALVRFEADASGRRIRSIVLADDSDAALAAALVGAKLPAEVVALPAARDAPSVNGRLIAQLASAYTRPA